ncbi:putative mhyt domain signaling [Phaeomoniella chlamydospora]|uniref:Putative mhyt domain signaling n=1 Tax=Phaeomoniella chlamydospora TaxID=158046 RepID=A0A0G2HAU5_PHACM|nr:putative mhyt domain signaling [Phaeomoniella chlamydospora]
MHWVATVGTIYVVRDSYTASTNQLSPTQTVIVCTILSCAACVLLLNIGVLTSRSNRKWRSRAQQLVLACAYFDENGRLMVNTEGQLPTKKITDHYVGRTFRDDEFGKTHPAFLWIYRATRHWTAVRDVIPGMRDHLLLNSAPGTLKNMPNSDSMYEEESGFQQDFEMLFKEMFCVSAQDLATQTHQSLENIGILYEEPLETGTLTNKRRKRLSLKNCHGDVESLNSAQFFGQGHFLFVVRNLNSQDATKFGASGYRFAAIPQVVDVQARSMQIQSEDLSRTFNSMRDYVRSEQLMPAGVHVTAFILRPNVRKGFDVLVTKAQSNQLPYRSLAIETLQQWQIDIVNEIDGASTAFALRWLKSEVGQNSEKGMEFCQRLYQIVLDLVESVNDPNIYQAKFSAKRVFAPCQTSTQYTGKSKCTLLSIRLITDIHSKPPNDKHIYKPLRLFNTQQQVYAGLFDQEIFTRRVHREFYHCTSGRDTKSENSATSSRLPQSPLMLFWSRKRKDSANLVGTAEKPLVANAAFGGIMVSNQVSVDVHDLGKAESNDSMELKELGTTGDATYASEDSETFIDELYSLFR